MNVATPVASALVARAGMSCREQMEGRFEALARSGEEAGWSADEVAEALLALAQAHVEARAANNIVLKLIERALAS